MGVVIAKMVTIPPSQLEISRHAPTKHNIELGFRFIHFTQEFSV
jgi:hypothetical protein